MLLMSSPPPSFFVCCCGTRSATQILMLPSLNTHTRVGEIQWFIMQVRSHAWDHSLSDSVVVIAFQIIFFVEIHINDVFLFFKNYFWHQHIKTIQNILNFNKKKLNFLGTRFAPRSQEHVWILILFYLKLFFYDFRLFYVSILKINFKK